MVGIGDDGRHDDLHVNDGGHGRYMIYLFEDHGLRTICFGRHHRTVGLCVGCPRNRGVNKNHENPCYSTTAHLSNCDRARKADTGPLLYADCD